jgi:hypothetical protein
MTATVATRPSDEERVFAVLAAAGPRGASHEDFVEAGLARGYAPGLERLASNGAEIAISFATGTPRWVLSEL